MIKETKKNDKTTEKIPNAETLEALKEMKEKDEKLPTFNTVDELFKDLES